MSVRGIIIEEVCRRIAAAAPDAKVLVARDAEDEPADDGQLVTIIPSTEKYWDGTQMSDTRSARQMTLVVAVGYQPAVGADALAAWKKLEDLAETITDALARSGDRGRRRRGRGIPEGLRARRGDRQRAAGRRRLDRARYQLST